MCLSQTRAGPIENPDVTMDLHKQAQEALSRAVKRRIRRAFSRGFSWGNVSGFVVACVMFAIACLYMAKGG